MAKTKKELQRTKGVPTELYNRARKQIGISREKIASFDDAAALKAYCDKISPQTNPDGRPKRGVVPKMEPSEEVMPDKFEIDSKMEVNVARNRNQFDDAKLQAELMRINRTYGRQEPVRIVRDSNMKPEQGKNQHHQNTRLLVTHFTIFMK